MAMQSVKLSCVIAMKSHRHGIVGQMRGQQTPAHKGDLGSQAIPVRSFQLHAIVALLSVSSDSCEAIGPFGPVGAALEA